MTKPTYPVKDKLAFNFYNIKNMSETYGFFFGRNPIRSGKIVCTDF